MCHPSAARRPGFQHNSGMTPGPAVLGDRHLSLWEYSGTGEARDGGPRAQGSDLAGRVANG